MRIFISYSSKNRSAVTALAADLERLGHDVWFDHDLTGGHAWWNDILSNIRACDLFVVALTPQVLDSYPCQLEGRYAAALNKLILPVLLSNVETALVPSILSTLQYVDYRQRNPDSVLALGRALGHLPAPRSMPSSMPVPPPPPLSPLASLRERIESPEPLKREDQATILMEIRELLNQRATAANARVLLQRFRQRNDLLASVANDIESLSRNSGRGRRTLFIGGVVVVIAFIILGSETLSLLTLSRKTPTALGFAASPTSQETPTETVSPTDTLDAFAIAPTATPTESRIVGRILPTDTPYPAATLTGDAYVSGSVSLDCQGFTANHLRFKLIFPNSGTPDVEIMKLHVVDGTGDTLFDSSIVVSAQQNQVLTGQYTYAKAPAYNPLVFTLSSRIDQIDVEKTYYVASGSCPDLTRLDSTPVPVDSVANVGGDYLALGYSNPPASPVKSSGGLSAKIRYKLTSATADQLQSGDIRLYLWVKRFADPACKIPIPVTDGLGIASRVEDLGLGTASEDAMEYDVAYVAVDTPYIALQGYIKRNSDNTILVHDYSTEVGCWKVDGGS